MTRMKSVLLGAGAALTTLGILSGVALADDGGVMQRLMGHDAYTGMIDQMRAVLGSENADQMIASCDAMMASGSPSASGAPTGMGAMMGRR